MEPFEEVIQLGKGPSRAKAGVLNGHAPTKTTAAKKSFALGTKEMGQILLNNCTLECSKVLGKCRGQVWGGWGQTLLKQMSGTRLAKEVGDGESR
jgi:hypothetical protein